METIREVFIANLVQLRGRRTQAQVAEAAGIPLRSYQRAEYGDIPHGPNLAAIARGLGVKETRLFLDPELMGSPEQALEVLRNALEGPHLSTVKRELLYTLSALDDSQAAVFLEAMRANIAATQGSSTAKLAKKS